MATKEGTTEQETFGKIAVNKYNGNRRCDASIGRMDENGEPLRCDNTAKITILRGVTGVAEFYCGTHTKDTWKEMLEDN